MTLAVFSYGSAATEITLAGLSAPVDDVDLFSAQFVYYGVDPLSVHSDARAHWIYVRIIGPDSNLCTGTCLPRDALDLYCSVFYLRHFCFKEPFYKFRMGTGNKDLWPFCRIF